MRAPHGAVDFLQHDRLHLRLVRVPAAPQVRRGRRGLFTKPASCRCLGLCASPPLALPVASRAFKETSVEESGRRVTATGVSDLAMWDD